MLDGALELVEVGANLLCPVFVVLGGRDELQPWLLSLAVLDLVGNGDEQARVGGALSSDTNGGGDVCPRLNLLAGLCGNSQVDCRVGPCAVALLAVEVLDEGGEGVQVAAGRVPANEDLAGVGAEVQGEHLLLVVHVDLDLLGRLGVGDGIAVTDFNLGAVFAAGSEQSADNALLVGGTAEGVVEDGEDSLMTLSAHCSRYTGRLCRGRAHLGLDDYVQRGSRGLSADGRWAERAGEVEEGVVGRHGPGWARLRWAVPWVVRGRRGGEGRWRWWGRNCIVPARCGQLASTDANIYFLEEHLQATEPREETLNHNLF